MWWRQKFLESLYPFSFWKINKQTAIAYIKNYMAAFKNVDKSASKETGYRREKKMTLEDRLRMALALQGLSQDTKSILSLPSTISPCLHSSHRPSFPSFFTINRNTLNHDAKLLTRHGTHHFLCNLLLR